MSFLKLLRTACANGTSRCGNYLELGLQRRFKVGFVRTGSDFKDRLILNLKKGLEKTTGCKMHLIESPPVKVSQVNIQKLLELVC